MQLCLEGRSFQPFIIQCPKQCHTSASPDQRRRYVHVASCKSKAPHQHSDRRNNANAEHRAPFPAAHCPRCPQHGPWPVLPSPSARLRHYLKHTLVFICGADDVTTSSTFPSPAVYIREPIWRYKTRRQEGGGPEPERREPWKPFYRAAGCWLI